jgi:hypothetical protein
VRDGAVPATGSRPTDQKLASGTRWPRNPSPSAETGRAVLYGRVWGEGEAQGKGGDREFGVRGERREWRARE